MNRYILTTIAVTCFCFPVNGGGEKKPATRDHKKAIADFQKLAKAGFRTPAMQHRMYGVKSILRRATPLTPGATPAADSISGPIVPAGEHRCQVAGKHGLAGSALGREQADDLAFDAGRGLTGASPGTTGGQRERLLDSEHDPVGELREQHHVEDAGRQRFTKNAVGAGGRDQHDRGGGDRPDRLDLGRGHVIGCAGAVQDHLSG